MIKSERLQFKPVGEEDIEWLRSTRNKYRDHFFDAHEISKEQQRAWYEKYKEVEGRDQMFIMQLKDTTPIGTVAIYNIDVTNRTAIFGRFLLLEEFRGQGYAEEAVKCMLKYCWDTLRIYKLKVEVFLDNIDAIAIYARAGFKTTTRPIILLENINENIDFKKPMTIKSYDALSTDGYESQETNIK